MIGITLVKKAVYSWSVRFRETVRDNAQLLMLSEEYAEDLNDEDVSIKEFEFACRSVRKRCSFFPKMCDILKYVDEYRSNPPQSTAPQIAEYNGENAPLTKEQAEMNKARIKILAMISLGKISYANGAKKMEQILKTRG